MRVRQWRHLGAVVLTCSSPFLFALSCSSHRASHPSSFLFVRRGRERDSVELRGAHLVGGNDGTTVDPGLGSPPPFLPRAVRSVSSGSDYIPLRDYVTVHGGPWARSTVAWSAGPRAPWWTEPTPACHVGPYRPAT